MRTFRTRLYPEIKFVAEANIRSVSGGGVPHNLVRTAKAVVG